MTEPNNIHQREVYNREVRREPVYVRQTDGTGAGVLFGVLIAGILAFGVGAFFLFNQRPVTQTPSKTTVIEKTKEVPVAQPKAPDVNIEVPQPKAPDVNVQVAPPTAPQPVSPSPEVQPSPDASVAPTNP
ncbi:hypothetical protein K9N68_27250 [Kovacikia minuta CCNUW1]|uniref:hypothetical protein n=1 Tax=Kovacikia minuta TaxID=2931930 RepID=UPI001CCEB8BA|nr:hypothetical protein [Kovacikia minuta]UBF25275.1 hypothetical protein K9N68_27250 [Kovacikia minuta CCNUW1]